MLLASPTLLGKSCFIETYKNIVTNRDAQSLNSKFIKSSDCPKSTLKKFTQIIFDLNGTIDEQKLNANFQEELSQNYVSLEPKKIEITPLSKFLRKNIKVSNQKILFDGIRDLSQSMGFGYDENIIVSCNDCTTPGEKNISVRTRGENPIWFSAIIKFNIKAIMADENISASFDSLKSKRIKLKEEYVSHPEKYIRDPKQLAYFKANKAILKGSLIKKSDLTKMNLVEMGRPVNILLEGRGFRIIGQGMPLNNGSLSETIKIRNIKTNKIVVGEVYDFNKVKVRL